MVGTVRSGSAKYKKIAYIQDCNNNGFLKCGLKYVILQNYMEIQTC